MTKNTKAAFEEWKLTEHLPCPPHIDPIEWACFNAFRGGMQASESRIMAELENDVIIEKVAKAIFDKDLLNCGNWDWEVQNQPDLTKRYRGIAKAAIQAITNHIKDTKQ